MRRTLVMVVVVIAMLALTATSVLANGHKATGNPQTRNPTVSFAGDTFTITGVLTGLGSGWQGAAAAGEVAVTFDIICRAPGSGNPAPGQQGQTGELDATGEVFEPDRSGRYPFILEGSVEASAASCPNANWTAEAVITSVELLSLTLTRADGETAIVRIR